jgi:hypothetical protein
MAKEPKDLSALLSTRTKASYTIISYLGGDEIAANAQMLITRAFIDGFAFSEGITPEEAEAMIIYRLPEDEEKTPNVTH